MRAVILAGGRGTRLRPYTTVIPKPLVPVGERPIVEIIIRQLAKAGIRRVDMCVSHLGGLIEAYLREARGIPPGVEVQYHWEEQLLGTAGALRQVQDLEGTFLVMNGDILTDLDYSQLVERHRQTGATLTIASRARSVQVELGVLEESDGRVTGFVEKPMLDYQASMGIYVYEARALEHLGSGQVDFPELVERLIAAGEPVASYPFEGRWFDIGTPGEHEAATREYEAGPERFDDG